MTLMTTMALGFWSRQFAFPRSVLVLASIIQIFLVSAYRVQMRRLYRRWFGNRRTVVVAYYEIVYHDLYLNDGYLMGSWIGRDGNGYQAWSTYTINPQSSIQANFRYAKIDKDFIPRGSTQWDATVSAMLRIRKDVQWKAFAQYESWLEPVVAPNRQRDFTTSVEVTWWPGLIAKRPLLAR